MDTRNKGKATVYDVPIIREYLDVFPEDFLGAPMEKHVEFRIDLVPSVTMKAKATYQ